MKNVTLYFLLLSILITLALTNKASAQTTRASFSINFNTISSSSPLIVSPYSGTSNCESYDYSQTNRDNNYSDYSYQDNADAHMVCSEYTMSYPMFEAAKQRLRQHRVEMNLMLAMKQEVNAKKITVYQVRELVGMLSIDVNRLEMAKYFFDFTCNRSRYFTINEMLLPASVQNLNQFLRGRDMSDDPSGTGYEDGYGNNNGYGDNEGYGNYDSNTNGSNSGTVVITPSCSNGNNGTTNGSNSPVVIIPPDNSGGTYDNSYGGYGNQNGGYGYGNNNYGNNGYGNGGYDHGNHYENNNRNSFCDALCDADFADVKSAISHTTFSDSKRQVMEQALDQRCVNSNQVRELLTMFTFDSDKVEAAKFLYPRTVDKRNYYKVNSAFTFSSSVDELNQYIKP